MEKAGVLKMFGSKAVNARIYNKNINNSKNDDP